MLQSHNVIPPRRDIGGVKMNTEIIHSTQVSFPVNPARMNKPFVNIRIDSTIQYKVRLINLVIQFGLLHKKSTKDDDPMQVK